AQLARRERGLDGVCDEREVPRLKAIAEDVDLALGQCGADEPAERHVGPLPGAVHREVPEADGRDLVALPVEVAEVLPQGLGRAVRRDRAQDRVLRGWKALRVAVDGG